jgi:hypothetical protein
MGNKQNSINLFIMLGRFMARGDTMPKFVYVSLNIHGDECFIAHVRKFVMGEGDLFEFNKIRPMPCNEEIENIYKDKPNPKKYPVHLLWRLDNWTTGWEPINIQLNINGPKHINYSFETRCNPPIRIIIFLQSQLPGLEITFDYCDDIMSPN